MAYRSDAQDQKQELLEAKYYQLALAGEVQHVSTGYPTNDPSIIKGENFERL